MARPKQPLEVAQLKGADRKDPQRYRGEVPKSDSPLGGPPNHMTKAQQECWHEIAFHAIPGVLTSADRLVMETLANMLAEYRQSPADFPTTRINSMIGLLGKLGMSPSDRRNLAVEAIPKANPYDHLDD